MSPAAIGGIIIAITIVLFVVMILVGIFMPRVFPDGKWGSALISGTVIGLVIGITGTIGGVLIGTQAYLQQAASPAELQHLANRLVPGYSRNIGRFTPGERTRRLYGQGEDENPIMTVPDNYETETCDYTTYRDEYKNVDGAREDNVDEYDDFNELDYLDVDGSHEQDIMEKFSMFLEVLQNADNAEQLNKLKEEILDLKHKTEDKFKATIDILAQNKTVLEDAIKKLSESGRQTAKEIINELHEIAAMGEDKSGEITEKMNELKTLF